MFRWIRNF